MDIRKWFSEKNNEKIEEITKIKESKMEQLRIWTDGSSLGNGQKHCKCGGVGVYFGKDDPRNISKGILCNGITNNKCELLAVKLALDVVLSMENYKQFHIQIFTDSEYLINTLTKWSHTWEKNNWKKKGGPIKNLELIQAIRKQMGSLRIQFIHVKAHTKLKHPLHSYQGQVWYGNKMADQLANSAAREVKERLN